jgi:hypothetical protein
MSINRESAKDDIIRMGISKYDFDIFGDNLYGRTRYWWDSSHIVAANNCTTACRKVHQYGGTALFSMGKAAHHIISKGVEPTP